MKKLGLLVIALQLANTTLTDAQAGGDQNTIADAQKTYNDALSAVIGFDVQAAEQADASAAPASGN